MSQHAQPNEEARMDRQSPETPEIPESTGNAAPGTPAPAEDALNAEAPEPTSPEQPDAEGATADTESAEQPAEQPDPLAEWQTKAALAQDRALRLRAELDNLRKRHQRELSDVRTLVRQGTIEEFMPVHDMFQMAMQHIDSAQDLDTMKVGMKMIADQFSRTFEGLGITHVETVGQLFDHHLHEAVSSEPSEEVPAEHIIRELKPGYLMGERLLRPASVVVSTGPASDDNTA